MTFWKVLIQRSSSESNSSKRFFILVLIYFAPLMTGAAPASLTYQGRIIKSDGTALEYNSVAFLFQITDPSGQCVIYQEQVSGVNMVNSGGVFDVPIGAGTVQYPLSGTFTVLDAFNNSATFNCGTCSSSGSTYSCTAGGSNYVASSGDGRKLRVSFYDGSGWKTISPDNVIRSVPYAGYALSAQKLGTNTVSDFILKSEVNNSGAGSVSCNSGSFLTWDATTMKFGCAGVTGSSGGTVTNVTSSNSYLSVTNGTSTPALTLNVGTGANTVAAGNDARILNALQTGATASGDLSGTYPGPTVVKIQGTSVSSTAPSTGQFLKYNGTNWTPSVVAISDVTNLSTQLSGYMTQSAFNADVASASCSAAQTMYWNSVSGAFACQNISIAGSQIAGNISGNAAGFTGSLSGDVSGLQGATSVDKIKGIGIDFSTAPTTGQLLQYNGSNWVPSSITAALPAFTGDVTSSAGSSVLTLASVGTAGTYTKVTTDAKGRVTSGTSLSASDIPNLDYSKITSGKPTTLSGYGITDAVKNLGNVSSFQSDVIANRPAAGTAGRVFIATDSQEIYQDNGSSWVKVAAVSSAVGNVTSVTSANTDISIANTTSTPVVTLNSGTGANQIVKLDASSKLPAVDGSALTNITTTIDKITNAAGKYFDYKPNNTACSNGQVLSYTTGTGWVCSTAAIGTVTAVTGTAPIVSSGGATPAISITQANTTTSGYLSSTDWNTFNNKQASNTELTALSGVSSTGILQRTGAGAYTTLGTSAPLSVNVGNISIAQATTSTDGYISSTDWNTFNNKQPALGFTPLNKASNLSDLASASTARTNLGLGGAATLNVGTGAGTVAAGDDSRIVNAVQNAGSGAGKIITSIQSGNTASRPAAGTDGRVYFDTQAGVIYRDNGTSWDTVASSGGSGGTVTGVTGTAPISSSGGTAPVISISQATTSTNGYLSSADWNVFNGKLSSSLADGKIWVGNSGTAAAVSPSGDATLTNAGVFSVTGLRGKTVSATLPTSAGQVLRYDGTSAYAPAFLGIADIKSTISPFGGAFASAACTSSQTLYWQSSTDTFQCQSISVTASSFGSQSQNSFLAGPSSGGAGAATFRGIASADLPTSGVGAGTYKAVTVDVYGRVTAGTNPTTASGYGITDTFVNGGNSFAGAANLGTNDNNTLGFKTNNSTRMTIDTAGNVGIGTTSPAYLLDVNGAIRSTLMSAETTSATTYTNTGGFTIPLAFIFGPNIGVTNDSGTDGSAAGYTFSVKNSSSKYQSAWIGAVATTGAVNTPALVFGVQTGSSSNAERMRIDQNGNVGIGTTSPGAKLDISAGTVTANSPIINGTQTWNSAGTTFSAATLNVTDTASAAASKLIDLQVGGVSKFSVDKSGNITSLGTTTSSGNTATTGNFSQTGSATFSTGTGAVSLNGVTSVTNTTVSTSSSTGSLIVGGGVGISGDMFSGASVNAATTMSAGTSLTTPQIYGSSAASGNIKIDGTSNATKGNVLLASAGGSVGIGTTTPGANLHIQSAASVMPVVKVTDGTNYTLKMGYGASGVGEFGGDTGSSLGLMANGSEFMRISTAGNVGIGTTGPTNLLTVNQSANTTASTVGTYGFSLWNQGVQNLTLGSDATYNYIQSWQSKPLYINSQGNNTLFGSGNVGIGTTTPTAKLHMVNDGYVGFAIDTATGSNFSRINMGVNSTAGLTWINSTAAGTGTSYPIGIGVGGVERLRIDTTGNIGIGTTAPAAKLHVEGNVSSGDVSTYVNNLSATAASAGYRMRNANRNWGVFLRGDAADGLAFQDDTAGAIRMLISSSGNIGIGTITPGNLLTVGSQSGQSNANISARAGNANSIEWGHSNTSGYGSTIGYNMGGGQPFICFNCEAGSTNNTYRTRGIAGAMITAVAGDGSISFNKIANANADNQSATEWMRIAANGYVGIGNTNPSYVLDVTGVARFTGGYTTSDQRYKRNIASLDNALDNILKLRGVSYDFRTDEFPQKKFPAGHQVGLIAQEVEKVFPEVVDTDKEGFKAVNYQALISPVIEAIKQLYVQYLDQSVKVAALSKQVKVMADQKQEQDKKIQDLERRLEKMESKIAH